MNKLLFALSLAKKSGNLLYGYDRVREAVSSGKAQLVLTAADASGKTKKNTEYFTKGEIPFYNTGLSRYELSLVTGRLRGVLAVTDENLAALCVNALEQTEGEL